MKTNTRRMLGIGATALSLLAVSAYGQWIGPEYYPDGGENWTNLGGISAGHTGGVTWQVDNLNPGAFQDLYFGAHSAHYPSIGVNGTTQLNYDPGASDPGNGKAVWTGFISIPLSSGQATIRDTRYTLSLMDLSNNPLGLIDSTTVSGFPTIPQAVLHVTDPAGFRLNHLFEIADGGGFDAANAVYDVLQTVDGNSLNTSVAAAFYAVIPEPGVLSMIGVCAGGLWFIRRRFV